MMAITPKHLIALLIIPITVGAQESHPDPRDEARNGPRPADTTITPAPDTTATATPTATTKSRQGTAKQTATQTAKRPPAKHYWRKFTAGFASSILLHEAGHVVASLAVGGHPRLGFDKWRPTIYSGIDGIKSRRKQLIFSTSGLNAQMLADELILDIPHEKGSPFERGVLAGGIATAYFYATLGRNASNSDITFIERTSSLSKTQASLIYASIATLHVFRISRDDHYANFFARPNRKNGLSVGVVITPEQKH